VATIIDERRRLNFSKPVHDYHFDVHLSHACNLTCESCSHFSNHHFSGLLSLETAESWYQKWSLRLRPKRVTLIGGEPTINPKLSEHVLLARKYWPNACIRLYTNGFFLHRHPRLPQIMKEIGNSVIEVSKHFDSPEYNQRFDEIQRLLQTWQDEHQIQFIVRDSIVNWTRRYHYEGGQLSPYNDGDPQQSWRNCKARTCKQLHNGKLWKCPILAYLPMVKSKVNLSPEWDFYLTYKPLEPDCSESELREFLSRKSEVFCAACPAYKRPFKKPDPTLAPSHAHQSSGAEF